MGRAGPVSLWFLGRPGLLSTLLFRLRRIELQLPLSIVLLLLVAVVVSSASAYRQVRNDAIENGSQRLEVVSSQLAGFLAQSFAQRAAETQALAEHPAVRGLVAAADSPRAQQEASAAIEALRSSHEHILAVRLWDAGGRLLLEARRPALPDAPAQPATAEPPPAVDSTTFGVLRAAGELAWFDVVGVVPGDGGAAGYVVQSRQAASPQARRFLLEELVGMDTSFVLGMPGQLWTDLERVVAEPPPAAGSTLGPAEYATPDRGSRFAFGRIVGATPWQLWVEAPRDAILRGPRAFLLRVTAIGAAIVLVGGLIGWGLSRGLTERLNRLRASANDIAAGNYRGPPLVEGEDEIGELAAAFNAMTARVAASHHVLEQQVGERTAELRASEEQFRTLAATASMSIVTADARGRVTYVNPAAEAAFGWSAGELVGQDLSVLMPERFRAAHARGLERYVAGGEPRMIGRTVELMGCHRDGREFPIELSLASWHRSDGELALCGIIQDVSARKHDEALLRKHASELETANRELEAFTYSASHDLRAPLRAIQGFGRYLLEDSSDQLDERGQDYVRRMCGAAERMRLLIDSLLELSRASRRELVLADVDVTRLARQIAAELRSTLPEREVDVHIADGLTARGDEHLLGVVLHNLLGNALKFTARRQRAQIELGALPGSGHVYFVKDNGAGFDMRFAGQLFSPFQRLHPESEFPGTGIGLSLVRRIVERHGGRAWAESEIDRGATFFFELPSVTAA